MNERAQRDPRLTRRRVAIPLPSAFDAHLRKILGPYRAYLAEDALWFATLTTSPRTFYAQPAGRRWDVGFGTGLNNSGPSSERVREAAAHIATALHKALDADPAFGRTLRALLDDTAPIRSEASELGRARALRGPAGTGPDAALTAFAVGDLIAGLAVCESTLPTPGSPAFTVWRGLLGDHRAAAQGANDIASDSPTETKWRFAQKALAAAGDELAADLAAIEAADWMEPLHAADTLSAIAENLGRRGDFPAAWKAAVGAVKKAPRHAGVHVGAAYAFELIGAFDEAEQLLKRAVTLDASIPEGHLGVLRLALWRGDHARALPLAKDAQARFPDRIEGFRGEAIAHFLADDTAAAIEAVDRALQVCPNDPETLLWRAGHRIMNADYAGALEDIQVSALRIRWPAQGVLHILLQSRRGDDVFEMLNHPALRDNFHDGLFTSTLPAWMGAERQARAETSVPALIEEVEALIGEMAGNRTALATRVRTVDGRATLERLPTVARSRTESGNALKMLRTHPFEDVAAQFDTLLATYPESPHPWCYRGELWLWKGDYDRAMADFDEGLRNIPVRWGFVGKAAIHILRGEAEAAEAQIQICAEKFDAIPGATTHVYVGELRRRQQRFAESEYELMEGLRAKPKRHAARMNLALTLAALGRRDEAQAAWNGLWEAIPGILWEAGQIEGVPLDERTSLGAMEVIAERALKMMRGNRSSHLITYFVDDAMRIAPDTAHWQQCAAEALDVQEELILTHVLAR